MTEEKKTVKPLRWRRQPNEKGLARVCQGRRGWELWRGNERVISVAGSGARFYWYGLGRNTLANGLTFATVDEAKADALKAAK